MQLSARNLIGLPLINDDDQPEVLGTVETVLVNPETMQVDGLLIGRAGEHQDQRFLPLQCVVEASHSGVMAGNYLIQSPTESRRILGLAAWTTQPHALVGFVYDCHFQSDTGTIDWFIIHQVLRTWRVPTQAVEKITPNAILIDTDTTVKLKLSPYPDTP